MPAIHISSDVSPEEKRALMREEARFEIADGGPGGALADLSEALAVRAKPAPPKVPKMFLSNNCVFNCAYCCCRASEECKRRYTNTPAEMARSAVDEAVKNGHGVFITSAIHKNADYTEELIIETLRIMREELKYNGYIHAKIMPGADPELIAKAGRYASRLSVNIEVAKSEGYARIAQQKNRGNILGPMGRISDLVQAARAEKSPWRPRFATSQTTQLMAGSTGEDDRTILTLAKALYRKYSLARVYYTAFQYQTPARGYNLPPVATPHWRMARLYQADRLLELYGFAPEELAPENAPFLSEKLDPKLAWALRNYAFFPVEVNRADYEALLRVPGIGTTYAKRIVLARRTCPLTFESLRRLGVPFEKCLYFITCGGRYLGGSALDHPERTQRQILIREGVAPEGEQLTLEI